MKVVKILWTYISTRKVRYSILSNYAACFSAYVPSCITMPISILKFIPFTTVFQHKSSKVDETGVVKLAG